MGESMCVPYSSTKENNGHSGRCYAEVILTFVKGGAQESIDVFQKSMTQTLREVP